MPRLNSLLVLLFLICSNLVSPHLLSSFSLEDDMEIPSDTTRLVDNDSEVEFNEADDGRKLVILSFICPGGGPPNFFTININIFPQGGFDTSRCTSTMKQRIGVDLNALLRNYGLGAEGKGDNAAYVAVVCTKPTSSRRRLQVQFVWKGGGNCKKCDSDNFDGRRLQDPNWFQNVYVPEMQNRLRNGITNTVAPKHVTCLGNGPRIDVYIQKVSTASQVPTQC